MQRLTNREYQVRLAWEREQWNKPSRSDHYSMLIALEILRANVKDPSSISLDDMKLKFAEPKRLAKPTKEQATAWAKAKWGMAVGLNRVDKKAAERGKPKRLGHKEK